MEKPETIFVPVKSKDRLPDESGAYFCILRSGDMITLQSGHALWSVVETWLEEMPSNLY